MPTIKNQEKYVLRGLFVRLIRSKKVLKLFVLLTVSGILSLSIFNPNVRAEGSSPFALYPEIPFDTSEYGVSQYMDKSMFLEWEGTPDCSKYPTDDIMADDVLAKYIVSAFGTGYSHYLVMNQSPTQENVANWEYQRTYRILLFSHDPSNLIANITDRSDIAPNYYHYTLDVSSTFVMLYCNVYWDSYSDDDYRVYIRLAGHQEFAPAFVTLPFYGFSDGLRIMTNIYVYNNSAPSNFSPAYNLVWSSYDYWRYWYIGHTMSHGVFVDIVGDYDLSEVEATKEQVDEVKQKMADAESASQSQADNAIGGAQDSFDSAQDLTNSPAFVAGLASSSGLWSVLQFPAWLTGFIVFVATIGVITWILAIRNDNGG